MLKVPVAIRGQDIVRNEPWAGHPWISEWRGWVRHSTQDVGKGIEVSGSLTFAYTDLDNRLWCFKIEVNLLEEIYLEHLPGNSKCRPTGIKDWKQRTKFNLPKEMNILPLSQMEMHTCPQGLEAQWLKYTHCLSILPKQRTLIHSSGRFQGMWHCWWARPSTVLNTMFINSCSIEEVQNN